MGGGAAREFRRVLFLQPHPDVGEKADLATRSASPGLWSQDFPTSSFYCNSPRFNSRAPSRFIALEFRTPRGVAPLLCILPRVSVYCCVFFVKMP